MREVDADIWQRNMGGLELHHSETQSIHQQVATNRRRNSLDWNCKQSSAILFNEREAQIIVPYSALRKWRLTDIRKKADVPVDQN